MARFLVIQDGTGLVMNAVEWDGDAVKWQPPTGHSALRRDDGNIGDTFDGTKFTPPAPEPVVEQKIDVLVDVLKNKTVAGAPLLTDLEKARLDAAR